MEEMLGNIFDYKIILKNIANLYSNVAVTLAVNDPSP